MKESNITLVFDSRATENPKSMKLYSKDGIFVSMRGSENDNYILAINIPSNREELIDKYLDVLKKTKCDFIEDMIFSDYKTILIEGDVIAVIN